MSPGALEQPGLLPGVFMTDGTISMIRTHRCEVLAEAFNDGITWLLVQALGRRTFEFPRHRLIKGESERDADTIV